MKNVITACCVLFLQSLYGQEIISTPMAATYCKPGVTNKSPGKGLSLEYLARPQFKFSSNSDEGSQTSQLSGSNRFQFKLKIPVIIKEQFKLLLGVAHRRENFEFDQIDDSQARYFDPIKGATLKSSRLSAYLFKPFNERFYATLKLEAGFNGRYEKLIDFNSDFATYRAAAIVGFKKSEDVEWGFGGLYSKNPDNYRVLPFVMYNRTFNDKWGIETALPVKMKARYNINEKSMLLMGTDFKSRSYSVHLDDGALYRMRNQELQIGLTYKRSVAPWVWMDFNAGYAYSFDTRFDEVTPNAQRNVFRAKPGNAPFVRLGLFLSPPRQKKY